MNATKILAGLLLVLALALGLGALLLGRQSANRPVAASTTSSSAAEQAAPTFAVVVAAKPLAAGQRQSTAIPSSHNCQLPWRPASPAPTRYRAAPPRWPWRLMRRCLSSS